MAGFIIQYFFLTLTIVLILHADNSSATTKLISVPLLNLKSPLEILLDHGIDSEDDLVNFGFRSSRTNDSIPLYKFFDTTFYATVGFGHPLQAISVIFDTTWSDNWVMSSKCSWYNFACAFRSKYSAEKSSSFVDLNKTFNVSLGNKKFLAGDLVNDTIYISHSNATNQTFGAATTVPISYLFSPASGALGLGLNGLSRWSQPIIQSLFRQKRVQKYVFSIYVNRHRTTEHGGSVFFGGSDPKHINGTLQYYRVKGPYYWEFPIDSLYVWFGKNKETKITKSIMVTIDTSTITISGPKQDILTIHKYIGAQPFLFHRYSIPCEEKSTLPHIRFVTALKNFTLSSDEYVQMISYKGASICLSAFTNIEDTHESSFNDGNSWIVGMAFLSRYYAEFDCDRQVIGFADLKY